VGFHLKRLGASHVRVLERHHIGAGQSGHAAGIVRGLAGHKAVASMFMASRRFFTNFKEEYGENLIVNPTGYLLINQSDQAKNLDEVIHKAKEGGCHAYLVSATEAAELQPGLRQNCGDIYAFEPGAIHVDPMMAVQALSSIARRFGVEVIEGCEVHSFLKKGSKIHGVETSEGRFEADNVLVATAAWGIRHLAEVGIHVPVYTHRAEMAFFAVRPESTLRLGRILSDEKTMLYMRPEGTSQIFVGWREGNKVSSAKDLIPADPDNYWQSANYMSLQHMRRELTSLLPFMSSGFIHRTYACVYDCTLDGMPILDRADSLAGLYFALGYSGSGFSLSPWVGSSMAQFIVEGRKSLEMDLLSLNRFSEGKLLSWENVRKGLH
jgi:sarcosine oxidase subunit beta